MLAGLMPHVERWLARSGPPRRPRAGPGRGGTTHGLAPQDLAELSHLFTSERRDLPRGYLGQARLRAAYIGYFLPIGVATVLRVLAESGFSAAMSGAERLRVVDLGAGPLTASLAVALQARPETRLELTAVDAAPGIMRAGADLMASLGPAAAVRCLAGDLRDPGLRRELPAGRDLVIMAHTLNEWGAAGRSRRPDRSGAAALVADLAARCLGPGGWLVLIEPGTRPAFRLLAEVRERLRGHPELDLALPCPGSGPCPYAAPGCPDWCHLERPWARPRLVQGLDAALGHRHRTLKLSCLVYRARAAQPPARDRYRAIGGPMVSAGTLRRYLCGPSGRVVAEAAVARLSPDHPLRRAWRGSLIAASELAPATIGSPGSRLDRRR